ncbi:hypothetical protein N9I33_02330, partial [Paracoccaceae bacterium]|nr:hypothetical protein [Paracoccaceae bacterium]
KRKIRIKSKVESVFCSIYMKKHVSVSSLTHAKHQSLTDIIQPNLRLALVWINRQPLKPKYILI